MGSKKIVYLDQNKWVELLKAEKSGMDSPSLKAAAALREAVQSGSIVVPLSAGHYLETWHRSNSESRHALARVMRDLSQFSSLAPVQRVQRWEIDLALIQYLGFGSEEKKPDAVQERVLGRGVDHAFASPTGRLRLVSSVASKGVPEGEPLDPEPKLLDLLEQVRALPNDAYEWWSLAGNENDSMIHEDWDTRGQHRIGDSYAEQERALSNHLSSNPKKKAKLDDLIATQDLIEISEDVHEAAAEIGIEPLNVYGKLVEMGGSEAIKGFLRGMPSVTFRHEARRLKHRNPQWSWQQHDHIDLASLSVAVPYADIVVTERQWAHLCKVAKLDHRFGTRVIGRLSELPQLLAA
ncbi:hypothetical protein [Streptomyces violaceoruber]|uniref:hypothetical protein n=1 Tax=Streptomyces violaceoruber TaxID=1935 RepID=UPI00131BFEEC|nr:hypothetical protein [Streptomyces violaceoruber]